MPTSSCRAYQPAESRMADAHREAEQGRPPKPQTERRDWPARLQRLGLRARPAACFKPDDRATEKRPGRQRPASGPTG